MPDGTYAPRSPDLSSFLSSPSPPKKAPTSSYTPKSPNLPSFPTSVTAQSRPRPQHLGIGPGYQPPQPPSLTPNYQSYNDTQFHLNAAPAQYGQYQSYLPPIPDLPPSHSIPQQPLQAHFQPQPFPPHQTQFELEPSAADTQLDHHTSSNQPDMSARSKRGTTKGENGTGSAQSAGLGPSQGIDIKTKFPVARIKRIMQADEEVGKVAQVTPVAVSKALELFMIELVTKSAAIAKSSNSKRVTAQHLKKVINSDEQYDFLNEIVSRVAEGPDAGGKRVKSEEGSDDEDGEKSAGGRATKKAKGRRKKGE